MSRLTSHVVHENLELLLLDGVPVAAVYIELPEEQPGQVDYPRPSISFAAMEVRGAEGDRLMAPILVQSHVSGYGRRHLRCEDATPESVATALVKP